MPPQPATLRVRGTAHAETDADFAVLSIAIAHESPTADEAVRRAGATADDVRRALDGEDVRRSAMSSLVTSRTYRWEERTGEQVASGWQARVSGSAEVQARHVSNVAARVGGAGAQLGGIRWELETDNPIHREVRRSAVAAAYRAAEDFADALDRGLGSLRALADPGLLAADQGMVMMAAPMMAEGKMRAGGPPTVDLDPPQITVTATVEATFEV